MEPQSLSQIWEFVIILSRLHFESVAGRGVFIIAEPEPGVSED